MDVRDENSRQAARKQVIRESRRYTVAKECFMELMTRFTVETSAKGAVNAADIFMKEFEKTQKKGK